MANLTEVALGIVKVLQASRVPEPLPIECRGQSLAEAAELVSRIVREASDADIALRRVAMDPALYSEFESTCSPSGTVKFEPDVNLHGSFELYRA